jgi:hypothetical protein
VTLALFLFSPRTDALADSVLGPNKTPPHRAEKLRKARLREGAGVNSWPANPSLCLTFGIGLVLLNPLFCRCLDICGKWFLSHHGLSRDNASREVCMGYRNRLYLHQLVLSRHIVHSDLPLLHGHCRRIDNIDACCPPSKAILLRVTICRLARIPFRSWCICLYIWRSFHFGKRSTPKCPFPGSLHVEHTYSNRNKDISYL